MEADVWLHEGKVVVGHTEAGLSSNRTLSSLYLEPLLQLLIQQNEPRSIEAQSSGTVKRVFQSNSLQTLTLLLDFKTDNPALWDHTYHELEPLRTGRYLTHFDGTSIVTRAVNIVVSGSAPFAKVAAQGRLRDMFFDAPLQVFASGNSGPQDLPDQPSANDTITNGLELRSASGVSSNAAVYSPVNSYYASGNFKHIVGHVWRSNLSDQQLNLIRAQIQGAHARGLKVRYWGLPSWPVGIRNYLWRVLVREGVDVLNVENVRAVAHDSWGPRKGVCRSGSELL